jgi:hypothetical protein
MPRANAGNRTRAEHKQKHKRKNDVVAETRARRPRERTNQQDRNTDDGNPRASATHHFILRRFTTLLA